MTPSSPRRSFQVTRVLAVTLILFLLGGAVVVRLSGDENPAPEDQASDDGVVTADEETRTAASSRGAPRKGSLAPDFTLLTLNSERVKLSDWLGRPVLINFWATWCGPCELEMPAIQAAYEKHRDDELVVLAVAVDDTAEKVSKFFAARDLTFEPLMDDGTVSRLYQVFGLPTSFFVAADGRITAVHAGLLTQGRIEEYLAQTLDLD